MRYEPMQFHDGGMSKVDRLVKDDKWVFEQKMDGTRGMAVVTHDRPVWWPGRGGRGALAHTAATQHLPKINPVLKEIIGGTPGEIVFDGEIMIATGEYHLFDVPYMRMGGVEVIQPTDTFAQRRVALDAPDLAALIRNTPVKVVRQAIGWREKAELLDLVAAEGGEGIMAKHLAGQYLPGVRTDAGLKVKLVKSADVVVMSVNRPDARHGSCTFGVVSPTGALVSVGGCSLIGKPEVVVGDVIEVNYLYFTDSKIVYQPRMMRVREDKRPEDCTFVQFRTYSRRAV